MILDAKICDESGHVLGTETGERDRAPESEGTEMEILEWEETIAVMIAINTRNTGPEAETGNHSGNPEDDASQLSLRR